MSSAAGLERTLLPVSRKLNMKEGSERHDERVWLVVGVVKDVFKVLNGGAAVKSALAGNRTQLRRLRQTRTVMDKCPDPPEKKLSSLQRRRLTDIFDSSSLIPLTLRFEIGTSLSRSSSKGPERSLWAWLLAGLMLHSLASAFDLA